MSEAIKLHSTTIKGTREGPRLLITGGVHGDEYPPMAAILRLAQMVKSETLCGQVTMIPVVNEAAYRREHRRAEDDLDLARVCPGRPDGSVTERTAHALSQVIGEAEFYIDLHTGGTRWALAPVVGYTLHPDRHILDQQREMARAFNLPVIWATSSKLDGRSMSVARDARVPALYAEWGGRGCCEPEAVTDYIEGCLNVMGHLGMIEREQPPSKIEHVVEDDREGSGHLQVLYPSPIDGVFETAVQLGQIVKEGQPIGTVTDFKTGQSRTVQAKESGILLFLRTFGHVAEKDSLAGIVELDGDGGGRT